MTDQGLYYGDYLQLGKLLGAQDLESTKAGETVHDEMLFIIVHQSYELWFKQVLWELDSVADIFDDNVVPERAMGTAIARLRRIHAIQGLLIETIGVLETMTPLDFLDFRDYLFPASGFQSAQFRLVENKLGLRRQDRMLLSGEVYTARFDDTDRELVEVTEDNPRSSTLSSVGWSGPRSSTTRTSTSGRPTGMPCWPESRATALLWKPTRT